MNNLKVNNLLKTIGPGIMFAGTCIGGSHLIQSTKAGAFYGYGLLGIILLANLFKYPFFEFASRYTNATGDSILEGYNKLGKSPLKIYGIATLFSMFVITAAIIAFTAGLANNMFQSFFNITISAKIWPLIIMASILGIISYGKFKILDITLKVIGVILVITISIAFFSSINNPMPIKSPSPFDILSTKTGFAFAIFLMGWMPMGVDMSAWHSLWTQERIKQTGYHPTLKETLIDFKIGYFITVILAIFFLSIGAKVLYGHVPIETIKSQTPVGYAGLLVDTFTSAIGNWSTIIITLAAFATMYGTAITLSDGYVRSIVRTTSLLFKQDKKTETGKTNFLTWTIALFIGSYLLIYLVGSKLSNIMSLATGTSFIIAPLAAYYNFKIIFNKEVPSTHTPPKWLKTLAIMGIIFLSLFTVGYLYIKFI